MEIVTEKIDTEMPLGTYPRSLLYEVVNCYKEKQVNASSPLFA